MYLLDKPGEFDAHALVKQAGKNVGAIELSPYMAGFVREIVLMCHSRGAEFSRVWQARQLIYRVSPVPRPEEVQKLDALTVEHRLLQEDYESLKNRYNLNDQQWQKRCSELGTAIYDLRRENGRLRRLGMDFLETLHESATPTPRFVPGARAPWELEYEMAGL
jgi:hypothetical protein